MTFHIAIPSYRRAEVLRDKTLRFLHKEGVDSSCITIFVADNEEAEYYHCIVDASYNIVVGRKGLCRQRQFIREYYPVGDYILSLDDDIRGIKRVGDPTPFTETIERLFATCKDYGLTTWGIYPVANTLFQNDRLLVGRSYLVGAFFGFLNTDDMLYPLVDEKEDVWYSLKRAELDGAVMRFENWGVDTSYYALGGMCEYRRVNPGIEETRSKELEKEFSGFCRAKLKRNGHWDIKITKQRLN